VRFRERFGQPVHVFYGASECGGICYDRPGGAAERGTVGTPVDGVRVELEAVDGDDGGAAGSRVVVRSPAVATGYLPGEGRRLGGGRYVTDDLACRRDGELALVGRLNDLINVKGKKVNPREVETVLAALPAVEDAVVSSGAGSGEGGGMVRAVIACRPGSLSAADVLAHCRRHLAEHKVPRSVVLVDALPRNERGKVDRAAVACLVARDVPRGQAQAQGHGEGNG
jgi:acyl-CoA synthetase (AMP-forming)/AMP-acid ligase II